MWLARRDGVTPSLARGWYTHIVAGKFAKRIRRFSGKVSAVAVAAADAAATLRLEHHARMQTRLTDLVRTHLECRRPNPQAFVRLVVECESVHIVTFAENYEVMKHDGNYLSAGIKLVGWRTIPIARRRELWRRMLRGRVANADEFAPVGSA